MIEQNQKVAKALAFDDSSLLGLESCESLALDLGDLPELSRKELFQALDQLDLITQSRVETLLHLHREIQEGYEELSKDTFPEKLSTLADGVALPAFPDIHRLTGAGRNESFSEIVRGIVKLEKIETALAPFQRQLQELGSALPSPLNEHLNPTVEGFGAAIKIIELIGQLESTLISRRSEHFDEDDFDVTIKDLEVKLHHLRLLRETITDCFDLEKLPESRELRAIQAQMLRRGETNGSLEAGGKLANN